MLIFLAAVCGQAAKFNCVSCSEKGRFHSDKALLEMWTERADVKIQEDHWFSLLSNTDLNLDIA